VGGAARGGDRLGHVRQAAATLLQASVEVAPQPLVANAGRIYGSLALAAAAAAGINFPALWANLAVGRAVAAVPDALPYSG
jgi:hypothetical protein